jgi:hypothetical protein
MMTAGCWSIWNHKNKIIFDRIRRDMQVCYHSFKGYVEIVRHTAKPSLKEGMQPSWTPCNFSFPLCSSTCTLYLFIKWK